MDLTKQETPLILNEATGELVRPEDWTREEPVFGRSRSRRRAVVRRLYARTVAGGFSPWALDLARETMALDLERIVMRTRKA